jgi:ferredoxin-NADP reductase
MDKHIVKILKTNFVTHNVKRFVVERPTGYEFVSGQACDIAINKPGLEEELRSFTFTCTNDADHLEFIIKIYTGHDGMTEKLLAVNAGDELIVHEVFGSITYQGPGIFIAGGAGITPFISIFRELKQQSKLDGNTLLFANRKLEDIILKAELTAMLGKNHVDVLDTPQAPNTPARHIDKELLKQHLGNDPTYYYICGPDKFTAIMINNLQELGVKDSQIVFEQ